MTINEIYALLTTPLESDEEEDYDPFADYERDICDNPEWFYDDV